MVQCGGVLGFAAEPQIEAGVTGQVGAQHLDGHVAVQPQIAGQVNLGHPAEAEDFAEFVAVGQVLWGGHRKVCSGAEGATCSGAGGANASSRDTPISDPP